MTKKNLFEKKLLTVSLGLAAVMLSFGLALALTNCGGDDGSDNGSGDDGTTWYVQVKNEHTSAITEIKVSSTEHYGTVNTVNKTGLSIVAGSDSGKIKVTGTPTDRDQLWFNITVTDGDQDTKTTDTVYVEESYPERHHEGKTATFSVSKAGDRGLYVQGPVWSD